MALYYNPVTGEWEDDGSDTAAAAPGTQVDDNFWKEIGMVDEKLDLPSADYSNEGKNYPTTGSTQGPGGSPVNASTSGPAVSLSGLQKLWKSITGGAGTTAQLAATLPLLYGMYNASKSNTRTMPSGYQGTIPKYTATRKAPAEGQLISGDVQYTKAAAGGGMKGGGFVIPADVVSHFGNGSSDAGLKVLAAKLGATPIRGNGDGMSDSIPTTIDGKQRALVAHEEAYLSPEKVARIGGGSAAKGAKKLRDMMERIREARTGTAQQGKKINPDRFMPGGEVKHYQTGGSTSATGVGSAAAAGVTGTESNLSNWAGEYVTDLLGRGKALAATPYEAYTGPLTAGTSDLQTQAFNAAKTLSTPTAVTDAAKTAGGLATTMQGLSYDPTKFSTGTFDTAAAQRYMNPYVEMALTPQLAELQRQAKIAEMADMSRLTKAGAYGGGRQAVLQAENTRNLLDKINLATGQGYSTAYDKAMAQFNAEQQRDLEAQRAAEQSKQYGATFGLDADRAALAAAQAQGQLGALESQTDINNLRALAELGATQRGISAEDIAAKKAQFEEARVNPYKMIQFEQSLLQGLPLAAQTYNLAPTSDLSQFASGSTAMQKILDTLGIKLPEKP